MRKIALYCTILHLWMNYSAYDGFLKLFDYLGSLFYYFTLLEYYGLPLPILVFYGLIHWKIWTRDGILDRTGWYTIVLY